MYLGLKQFSARKNAKNFSLEELARLKTLALRDGKNIYVAINTVITEDEMDDVFPLLYDLAQLGVDGIIVQDWGLLSLIRNNFPSLAIHASTQMAVHNADGVRAAAEAGAARVILARELTLEEICRIREACPETELEVFIHGALCYGFSGLCLASGKLLGRSGNRGECAQICRTWFASEEGTGYFFSSNDLSLEEDVLALQAAGIDALKIEGRMKPPEYAGAAAAYYRSVLDGMPQAVKDSRLRTLRTVFSRKPTKAFFDDPRGTELINTGYPSHLGIPAGQILDARKDRITVKLSEPLSIRDGILCFKTAGSVRKAIRTGITAIERGDRSSIDARPGDTVKLPVPELPDMNSILYKISAHDLTLPEISASSEKPAKFAVPVSAVLSEDSITINGRSTGKTGTAEEYSRFSFTFTAKTTAARNRKPFMSILAAELSTADESAGRAELTSFTNLTEFPDDGIFIPPSALKHIRKSFYEKLDRFFDTEKRETIRVLRDNCTRKQSKTDDASDDDEKTRDEIRPPLRSSLIPAGNGPVPFVTAPGKLGIEDLAVHDGRSYFPLAPVVFDTGRYFREVIDFIRNHEETDFVLGLCNPAHIFRTKELSELDNVSFFIDYGLYCANTAAFRYFTERIPRLRFVYYWIEGTEKDMNRLEESATSAGRSPQLTVAGEDFKPPLFISRSCIRRHALGGRCGECGKSGIKAIELKQQQNEFIACSRECITYLIQK